jgi:hypothetical protein
MFLCFEKIDKAAVQRRAVLPTLFPGYKPEIKNNDKGLCRQPIHSLIEIFFDTEKSAENLSHCTCNLTHVQ